jgi:hypothetical protein
MSAQLLSANLGPWTGSPDQDIIDRAIQYSEGIVIRMHLRHSVEKVLAAVEEQAEGMNS